MVSLSTCTCTVLTLYRFINCARAWKKKVVVMEQNKNTISEDLLGVMSGNVGSVCTIV